MKLTEKQLNSIIAESTRRVLSEIGYHEKQKRNQSEEEHEAWLRKKSAAKKRYYDSQNKKKEDDKDDAIDYYDYKHGKGNFRAVKSGEKVDETISRIVKNVIKETTLDYDMDNFSGRWNRGTRYDILVDGYPEYHDVPEEAIDRCYDEIERKYRDWGEEMPKIEVVEL